MVKDASSFIALIVHSENDHETSFVVLDFFVGVAGSYKLIPIIGLCLALASFVKSIVPDRVPYQSLPRLPFPSF